MIGGAIDTIARGLGQSFLMAYQVWWALVLGFAISAVVQAWVPRERIEGALSGSGPRPVAWATGLGAASSSCSYAAIAISRNDIFGSVQLNYKLVLNLLALAGFIALLRLRAGDEPVASACAAKGPASSGR